ncbi:MAG: class II fructose-bisphosphate aldolase [Acidobacteriota bacterium]
MELFLTSRELARFLERSETVGRGEPLRIVDPGRFREGIIDSLVWTAVFGDPEVRDVARRTIREAARELGILPASILPLYEARGRGEVDGFSVPAVNIRMLSYDTMRAALRAAKTLDAGALIFEIARSEIGYTDQRPGEYAAVLLGAAIREGWTGPLFLQGDHYQTNPKKMKEDPDKEIAAIEALIDEAIPSGFFQIDIDTSTLVDLSKKTLPEQQDANCRYSAVLTEYIREHEPKEMPISIGGEIGEVGKENSTPEELRAYMNGYRNRIGDLRGLAKVSVQTGSSHGGLVGPDGTVQRVAIDFATLERISKVAREEYGLAGAVQHGASTLSPELFGQFPRHGCAEIHLATEFQNMVFEHPSLPYPLKRAVDRWVFTNMIEQKKPGETQEQFLYKNRKQAIGPFKEQFWNLPVGTRDAIADTLEKKFRFLFETLRIGGTRATVDEYVRPVDVFHPVAALAGAGAGYVRDDEAGD